MTAAARAAGAAAEEPVLSLERLAHHLLERGTVTREQVDEARRTQDFFGGQLASHLLKLGFVDEATLGEALTEVTGAPYASPAQLRIISPDPLSCLTSEQAERLKVCPFDFAGRALRVAMLNPRDAVAMAEIRSVTGHPVEPWVTCEYRLYQALEKHYRIRVRLPRAVSLAPPLPHEREAAPEPAPEDQPETVSELGLDGRPLDAEPSYGQLYPTAPPNEPETTVTAGNPPLAPDALGRLEERLIRAEDRDAIADALMEFCAERAPRSALFAVGKDGIRGIAGRGRALEPERLRSLVLPVEPSTVFDTAITSRDFFFGVVPPMPANRDLYTALGGKLPAMAMVLPILVKDRIAALLYLDDEDRPMSRPDIPLMRRVAAKAGLAFEVLLLRGKLRKI